jgi:beta-galactosidase/beta-glucuronidase
MAFNITDALQPDDNVVVVHAFDDTRSGLQALGKQAMSEHSEGCVYTRTTGIWQSVWLEAVPDTSIAGFQVVPDLAGSRFLLQIEVAGATGDEQVQARLAEDGTEVSRSEAPADFRNARLELAVPNPRPWSPADPHLYDLVLEVVRNGVVVDRVDSYAGLRTVTIRGNQVLLNGERVFQRLVLDQGFYPDGIWTAPSYEALERDIDLSMQAGFNGARLHEKVFEPLFLYLAAKKGYLVWGEFPNWGLNYADTRIDRPMIEEWVEIVRRDRNQPAVIGWCPFNETPAEARPLQQTVVRLTRELDPTRPVLETSGWSHGMPDPEMKDDHDYNQDPISFAERWAKFSLPIPFMVSEYGGIGWNLEGGWGYGNAPATIEEFYDRLAGLSKTLLDNVDMFGYCYTQLTDVEQEKNGVYAYDRSPKFDMARVRAALTGS